MSTCGKLGVSHFPIQRWNVASSQSMASASNSRAITSEKHYMSSTCKNLGVCNALIQGWNVALPVRSISARNSTAITSEKHCMLMTCRNLGVSVWNFWVNYPQTSSAHGQALNKSVPSPNPQGTNLGVSDTIIQGWNVALSEIIPSAGISTAVTSDASTVWR